MIGDLLVVVTSLRYQFLDALFLSISCLSSYVSRQCFHNQLMCLKLQTDTSISPSSPSHPTHTKLENGVITWTVIFLYHTIFQCFVFGLSTNPTLLARFLINSDFFYTFLGMWPGAYWIGNFIMVKLKNIFLNTYQFQLESVKFYLSSFS